MPPSRVRPDRRSSPWPFDGLAPDDPGIAEVMAREEYEMHVDIGRGVASAELFFCDLTHAYVSINCDYTT